MKTLDEMIKALERCGKIGGCKGCKYARTEYECSAMYNFGQDALHYLKEYKNQQDFYSDGIKRTTEMIDKCEKTVAEYLAVNNPPLTWDELCSRNGMPIWIEDSFDNGEWYIIECFTASNRFVAHDRWGDTTLFNKKEMDDVWKAYRREHHEN